MNPAPLSSDNLSFLERLRIAGIEPGDSEDLRLNKQLLMFATGLISATSMLWTLIYWAIGPKFSITLPYLYQLLLAGNVVLYIHLRNYDFFRLSQLAFFCSRPLPCSGMWATSSPVAA